MGAPYVTPADGEFSCSSRSVLARGAAHRQPLRGWTVARNGRNGPGGARARHSAWTVRWPSSSSPPTPSIRSAGERFGREARSSAGFAHPNAVTAFDAGESDGFLYLVMELVDGSSLAELLADGAPLPIDQALHIEDSILAALGAAHAAGIVHRDVKPGNVLLGAHGRVKLADFGIARRLDDLTSDLTGVGQFIGTPKYLAPEQLAGEPATPASDLYAAGVVLYEMLAGEPPFDAAMPMELAWAHQNAPVPDVRVLRPDVPAPVVATIATAMAKHPGQRFATADAMRRSLTLPAVPAGERPATALLAAPVLPPTVIGPTTERSTDDGPPPPSGRWGWVVALAVLVALIVGGVAVALARQDDGADPTATTAGRGRRRGHRDDRPRDDDCAGDDDRSGDHVGADGATTGHDVAADGCSDHGRAADRARDPLIPR